MNWGYWASHINITIGAFGSTCSPTCVKQTFLLEWTFSVFSNLRTFVLMTYSISLKLVRISQISPLLPILERIPVTNPGSWTWPLLKKNYISWDDDAMNIFRISLNCICVLESPNCPDLVNTSLLLKGK